MYFPQRHHNVHNKNRSHDQEEIVFYHAKIHAHTHEFTIKQTKRTNAKQKENESKQKREGTNIIASQFYGRILWVWSKRCKSEPQAAEAAQRDHAYDDCKSKDKQTQDLQHKNESIITTRNEYQTTRKDQARYMQHQR
eukprot:730004_1